MHHLTKWIGVYKKSFPMKTLLIWFFQSQIFVRKWTEAGLKNHHSGNLLKMTVFTYIFKICDFQTPIFVQCLSNFTICLQHVCIEKKNYLTDFQKCSQRIFFTYLLRTNISRNNQIMSKSIATVDISRFKNSKKNLLIKPMSVV